MASNVPRSSRDKDYEVGTLSLFPREIDSSISMRLATNDAESELTSGIGTSDRTVYVADTGRFPHAGVVRVGRELMYYTSKSQGRLAGVIRGWSGSPVSSHGRADRVTAVVDADHHNAVRDALMKIQAKAGLSADDEETASLSGRLKLMERRWGYPEASFRANIRRGHRPLTVTFQNTSRGFPTTCRWDFGDGSYSDEYEPSHVYTTPGEYTVALEITTRDAGYSRRESVGYIDVLADDEIYSAKFCVRVPEPVAKIGYEATGSADGELRQILSAILMNPSEQKQKLTAKLMGISEITYDGLRRVISENGGVQTIFDAVSVLGDTELNRRVADFAVYVDGTAESDAVPAESRYRYEDGQALLPVNYETGARVAAVGQEVEFVDQTAGAVARREWDFGDGRTYSVDGDAGWRVRHTYARAGSYLPRISVISADGTIATGTMKLEAEG